MNTDNYGQAMGLIGLRVERMFEHPEQRRFCMSILADTIVAANAVDPNKWSVSFGTQIDVNVGGIVVCAVRRNKGVWLLLKKGPLLSVDMLSLFPSADDEWNKDLPGNIGVNIPQDASLEAVQLVWEAHVSLITASATKAGKVPDRSQEAHSSELLTYLTRELERPIPMPNFQTANAPDNSTLPSSRSVWWVNQGTSYSNGLKNHSLWAPIRGNDGREPIHWTRMQNVKKGDVVVHYSAGNVRAISRVEGNLFLALRPSDHPISWGATESEDDGISVEMECFDLRTPINLDKFASKIMRLGIKGAPLSKNGGVNQGYLYRLNEDALDIIHAASSDTWPDWAGCSAHAPDTLGLPVKETTTMPYSALVSSLRSDGLFFSEEVISNFLLALQTKRFVILSGISGTGKTQLAMAVARHYRIRENSVAEINVPETAAQFTVLPYSRKYNRVVLPVKLAKILRLSSNLDNKSTTISVIYPGGAEIQTVSINDHSGNAVTTLLFSKGVRQWFENNLKVGDHYFIDIEAGENDADVLRIGVPDKVETGVISRYTYANIAVRPDWTDNRGLLGYYNPITAQYHVTPFLSLLLQAAGECEKAGHEQRSAHPYFVILDEMNLARAEYYFSDFLSCLESGEALHLHDSECLEDGEDQEAQVVPKELAIPKNVFFVGTVNVDETTSMFSPKVIDRAFILEFNAVDLIGYGSVGLAQQPDQSSSFALPNLPELLEFRGNPVSADWQDLIATDQASQKIVITLHRLLSEYNRHFGYRVANEIARFLTLAAIQTGGGAESRNIALDLAVLQKVLPKFHGTQQELNIVLAKLFSFAISGRDTVDYDVNDWTLTENSLTPGAADADFPFLPRSATKLWRMIERLREQGFTSFME